MTTTELKPNCRLLWYGEIATFNRSHVDAEGFTIVEFTHGGVLKFDNADKLTHAPTCTRHLTVDPEAPKACSWCEAVTGIRTQGSHGICKAHFDQQIAAIAIRH